MGSPFESKMMIKLIIFTLASAAMVLGAPKGTPADPRKFAKAPDFVAPATYRQEQETQYANKNLERLDKRSAIEGIPDLLTKKEFVEDQGIMEKYKAPAAPAKYSRQGPVYTKKSPERLDKRSAIEGIPDLLTKKENKAEEFRHLEIHEEDKFLQEAPLLTLTQEQELPDEDK